MTASTTPSGLDGFTVRDGTLCAGHMHLTDLAQVYGTPLYIYNADVIRDRIGQLKSAFSKGLPADRQPLIAYACKANTNGSILRLMNKQGLGADVTSLGELRRARQAGIPGDKIVFSGVGKTEQELIAAIESELRLINIESGSELEALIDLAPPYPLHVSFRMNPDVQAGTHAKISTGHAESKFGIAPEEIVRLHNMIKDHRYIKPTGLSVHLGSQMTTLDPFESGFKRVAELARELKTETIDFGGGLGILYSDEILADLSDYAGLVNKYLAPAAKNLITEPGRFLVGNAGILLTRAVHIKHAADRPIVVLDAGMNDLIRPAMYDAVHRIIPVEMRNTAPVAVDVAGPVCESSDIFARNVMMPLPESGDLVAIMDAGAYGFSMASTYNSRPLPAELLVDGNNLGLVRKRQAISDLITDEMVPAWLT